MLDSDWQLQENPVTEYGRIDAVMHDFYATISGGPGEQDWERAAALFHPGALMVRTRIVDGEPRAWAFDHAGYVASTRPLLAGRSFHEIEIAREVVRFGQIAQCFSTYEARETPGSAELIFRGVNMLHLWNDGTRWWIMSVIWDNEREGLTLPARWLAASHAMPD